ncbi:MAG: hypothetical protein JXA03_09585 [Bacteroidales bacterium]|nr:hypothetical protein [Bacteroidales bacterium]
MKKKNLFLLLIVLAVINSCSKNDDDDSGNNNPPATAKLGDVGNEWKAKFNNQEITARIVDNNNGILSLAITTGKDTDTIKAQLTGNSISEFVHSYGDIEKPFTLVEFDAKVGDIYTFEMGGLWFERQVTERETYHINCLGQNLETIGVYEEIPYGINVQLFGITIRSIVWYFHPTYGLVCVEIYTEQGEYFEIEFISIKL